MRLDAAAAIVWLVATLPVVSPKCIGFGGGGTADPSTAMGAKYAPISAQDDKLFLQSTLPVVSPKFIGFGGDGTADPSTAMGAKYAPIFAQDDNLFLQSTLPVVSPKFIGFGGDGTADPSTAMGAKYAPIFAQDDKLLLQSTLPVVSPKFIGFGGDGTADPSTAMGAKYAPIFAQDDNLFLQSTLPVVSPKCIGFGGGGTADPSTAMGAKYAPISAQDDKLFLYEVWGRPASAPAVSSRFRQVSMAVGKGPRWITVADVNHDHNPDIVVANADDGTVTVLLGDGAGGFHAAHGSPFAAGHLPNDIAVADMNGDGIPDLVIANHQSPYVTILLGDGSGGFRPAPGSPVDVHSNPHPHAVAVADFNGDGKLDVVTDSWGANQIELLRGDGTGRLLTPAHYFNVGHRPYERVHAADFNHDGIPDVITTNLDDGTVSILLGDGKGGFHDAAGSPFRAGAKPWEVAVEDINGDGNLDLIVVPYQRDIAGPQENAVTILLGDGKGAFKPMPGSPLSLEGCRGPNSVAAGDLRGDGRQAVVVACAESRNLVLFERGHDGRFESSSIPSRGGWGAVAVARLTQARGEEVLTADHDAGTITIYFQN